MRTRDQGVDDGDNRLDMSMSIMMIVYTRDHVYIQNADAMGGAWGWPRVGTCHDTWSQLRSANLQKCLVEASTLITEVCTSA